MALKEHEELADPPEATDKLTWLHDTASPDAGLTDSLSPTVPENPPRLVAVMVVEAFEPSWKPTIVGLAVSEKSATFTVIWAV